MLEKTTENLINRKITGIELGSDDEGFVTWKEVCEFGSDGELIKTKIINDKDGRESVRNSLREKYSEDVKI